MGLFDKKNCDICGEKIGLLGNRKLDDGNLCKNCASKLSPWFEERRHSTVEDIKRQLAYREENKNAVRSFSVTREFSADRYHVFIDDNKGMFAIAFNMSEQDNPDIYKTSVCPLAKVMRRELKKRGIKKLKVVYSQEKPTRPIEDMSISCRSHCICPPAKILICLCDNIRRYGSCLTSRKKYISASFISRLRSA